MVHNSCQQIPRRQQLKERKEKVLLWHITFIHLLCVQGRTSCNVEVQASMVPPRDYPFQESKPEGVSQEPSTQNQRWRSTYLKFYAWLHAERCWWGRGDRMGGRIDERCGREHRPVEGLYVRNKQQIINFFLYFNPSIWGRQCIACTHLRRSGSLRCHGLWRSARSPTGRPCTETACVPNMAATGWYFRRKIIVTCCCTQQLHMLQKILGVKLPGSPPGCGPGAQCLVQWFST